MMCAGCGRHQTHFTGQAYDRGEGREAERKMIRKKIFLKSLISAKVMPILETERGFIT